MTADAAVTIQLSPFAIFGTRALEGDWSELPQDPAHAIRGIL